jgi:hypothetical protein
VIRILFTYVVPILLPTILYFAWLSVARRTGKGGAATAEVPWTWLLGAGVLLTAVLLGGVAIMGGRDDGVWVPAHTDAQGRVVPGHFE